MDKPLLVVYGNCQAEAMCLVLSVFPRIVQRFSIKYVASYEHPAGHSRELAAQELYSTAIVLEQHDPLPFPHHDRLPARAKTVKFPSLDSNVLWPFSRSNPYNEPEPPRFLFGRFPYGDRIIIDCIEKGMPAKEIMQYYKTSYDLYAPDMDRLLKIEVARLSARDSHCDVKMAQYVLDNFRERRLLWTIDHPTNTLLNELIVRLLNVALPDEEPFASTELDAICEVHFAREPLSTFNVPIHPRVAEHFGLRWYNPNERYEIGESNASPYGTFVTMILGGKSYSYAEYFESMIRASLAVKKALQTAV